MQSHLSKVPTVCNDARAAVAAAAWGRFPGLQLTREQCVLLGPVERQIELAQTRRGEYTGLPPLQDRLDQLRAQEGKANQTPDVAPGDAVTLGQFLERSGTTGGELLKPCAPAGDRLDQRRITSRSCRSAARVRAAPVWFQHRAA